LSSPHCPDKADILPYGAKLNTAVIVDVDTFSLHRSVESSVSKAALTLSEIMGSSAKKKREKKKDFQKTKLKVGKAKPAAANSTDTAFRAKAIVLNQQLNVDAPTAVQQFHHHVSLLSSKTESQRRESLAFLTTYLISAGQSARLPLTVGTLVEKVCPLILDGNTGVRQQLLKFLQVLPQQDLNDQVQRLLPHIRAGMMHLSRDIRLSAVEYLSCLIATTPSTLVSCAGGWYSTLDCFTTMLAWRIVGQGTWTASKSAVGDGKALARVITVLAQFLEAGLLQKCREDEILMRQYFPYVDCPHYGLPAKSDAYAYLNLFGAVTDDKTSMLEDLEDRLRVYRDHFHVFVQNGVTSGRKEGGEVGRATGLLAKVLDRAVIMPD
jgi:pre-rRNA-processing protein IPI1